MKNLSLLITALLLSTQLGAIRIKPGQNKRPSTNNKQAQIIEVALESKSKDNKSIESKSKDNKSIKKENVNVLKIAIEDYILNGSQVQIMVPGKLVGMSAININTTLEKLVAENDNLEIFLNKLSQSNSGTRKIFFAGLVNHTSINKIVNIKKYFNDALKKVDTSKLKQYLKVKKNEIKPSKLIKAIKITGYSLPIIYAIGWTLYLNQDLIPEKIMVRLLKSPELLKNFINIIFYSKEQVKDGSESIALLLEQLKTNGVDFAKTAKIFLNEMYNLTKNNVEKHIKDVESLKQSAITSVSENLENAFNFVTNKYTGTNFFKMLENEYNKINNKEQKLLGYVAPKLLEYQKPELKKSWLIDNPLIRFFMK